jgi:hypothetical protein
MKDIINREIKSNFGNWELSFRWGRYGSGSVDGNESGSGSGYGLRRDRYKLGNGAVYGYGDSYGNGGSKS